MENESHPTVSENTSSSEKNTSNLLNFNHRLLYVIIFGTIILLLASNTALVLYIRSQDAAWAQWHAEKQQYQKNLQAQAMASIASWQAEISLCLELERAGSAWYNGQHELAWQIIEHLESSNLQTFPILHFWRGLLYQKNNHPKAINEFGEYLRCIPDSPYAYWHRAHFAYQQKKYDLAKSDLERLLAAQPDFPQAQALLDSITAEMISAHTATIPESNTTQDTNTEPNTTQDTNIEPNTTQDTNTEPNTTQDTNMKQY